MKNTINPRDLLHIDIRKDHIAILDLIRGYQKQRFLFGTYFKPDTPWSLKRQSYYIESLFLNLPAHPFLYKETIMGQCLIVDGVQRMNALLGFIKGEFQLEGLLSQDDLILEGLEILPEINGCKFSDIPSDFRAYYFEERMLPIHILKPSTTEDVVKNIHNRINSDRLKWVEV